MKRQGKIRLIGSPPASGKSEVIKFFRQWHREQSMFWMSFEHEDSFTPQQRVMASEVAEIALSDKKFVLGYNLPGQLGFQALLRTIADQGHDVIGFGPFENVYQDVGGLPLYRKMQQVDFAGYDFGLVYFLVTGEGAEVEATIQERLIGRASKSEWQPALDADKVGVQGYYEKRAAMVRESARTFDLPLINYPINGKPEQLAKDLLAIL